MYKMLLLPGLMLLSSSLSATQCYYYWTADCFDIRDALNRDITHHVFLSREVQGITLAGAHCDADAFAAEHPAVVAEATDRINKALDRVKSCRVQQQILPKVFDSHGDAASQWQQLSSEQPFKQLRWLKKLP